MDKNINKLKKLNEKIEEEAAIQEEELLIDFDAAIEERESKPIKVKFLDKIYEIPAAMPFKFSMFFFRNCMKKVKGKQIIDIPDSKIEEFITLQLGEEILKATEESNVSLNFVMDTISSKILDKWGFKINKNIAKKK